MKIIVSVVVGRNLHQTLINDALRASLSKQPTPVDARTVRRIVREETNWTADFVRADAATVCNAGRPKR
jgi:hypothetical protein